MQITLGKPTLRTDGRWMVKARFAPGPKGRVNGYGATPEQATEDAFRKAEQSIPTYQALDEGSFARFVFETWWPHVLPGLRKTSRRRYDSLMRNHALPILGHYQISEVGYKEFKALTDSIPAAQGHTKHSVIMRSREVMSLHNAMASGRGERVREDWKLVKPPVLPKKKKRIEPQQDFAVQFFGACRPFEVGPHLLGMALCLRRGEVCGLRWDKIDRQKLTITVNEQHQRESGDELVDTKGDERILAIPAPLLERIDQLGDKNSPYVFTMPRPGKGRWGRNYTGPMQRILPDTLTKTTPRICKLANLPSTTFHDLRSHAASTLAALGVDPVSIMEILGHTELDTSTIYMNAKNQVKRKALERLLDSIIPVEPCAVEPVCPGSEAQVC